MGRKVVTLLVMGLLGAVLTVGPVVAQANPAQPSRIPFEPSDFTFVFPDPCNLQEEVTITGSQTGFITEVVTPTGDIIRTIHLRLRGTGVGSEGSEYSFNSVGTERLTVADLEADPSLYTASGTTLINNLGDGPNFLTHDVIHVTGLPDNPVVEVRIQNTKCLG